MIRMWMIRHGESESNIGLPSSEPAGSPLTPLGCRQANEIARGFPDPPALIAISPYVRAQQTAEPTINRFPAAARQEWPVQEFTYLNLRDRATTSSERRPYVEAYWNNADPHGASDNTESFANLIERVHSFLERVRKERISPVAVFTHGIFMKSVAWSLLTGITTPDTAAMRNFRGFADAYLIPNGGIIEIHYVNDTPSLMGGSAFHLPGALLSQSPSLAPSLELPAGQSCQRRLSMRAAPAATVVTSSQPTAISR